MSRHRLAKRAEKFFVLACVLVVTVVAGRYVWKKFFKSSARVPAITVSIEGNVKKPGTFRVPWGSTVFEVLEEAGITSTSDINHIVLAREAKNGESIRVGQLDAKVDASQSAKLGACELDFYQGAIDVKNKNGETRTPSFGLFLMEGNVLVCNKGARARVKFHDKSAVALAEGRAVLEEIGKSKGSKSRHTVYLQEGRLWANIHGSGGNIEYYFRTPHLGVLVKGTEFSLRTDRQNTSFKLYDGMAFVENSQKKQGVNVVSGQEIVATAGDFPIRPAEFTESGETEEFQQLQTERDNYYQKNRPFSALLCGVPNTYIFLKMNPAKKRILTVHIPTNTWVGNLVVGFNEFDKAFLYGGAKFSASIAERLLRTKLSKYAVITAEGARNAIDILGGINVDIDSKASAYLSVTAGRRTLSGNQATKFMSPAVSGVGDAHERQKKILTAFFEGLRGRNILLTSQVIGRIVANTEGNLSVKEMLQTYSNFNAIKGWEMKTLTMPGKYFVRDGDTFLRPLPDKLAQYLR